MAAAEVEPGTSHPLRPKLVVGLGNPGPRYARTRHNAGFLALDRYLGGTVEWRRRPLHEETEREVGGRRVRFLRPLTYMNRSGLAVAPLAGEHALTPPDLLVLADDVALPLGRLRLRPFGGHGGHNGLRSILDELQSNQYPRLRIGVGGPLPDEDLADFVLAPLEGEPWEALERTVALAAEAVGWILEDGVESAMNRVNAPPSES